MRKQNEKKTILLQDRMKFLIIKRFINTNAGGMLYYNFCGYLL